MTHNYNYFTPYTLKESGYQHLMGMLQAKNGDLPQDLDENVLKS